MGGRAPGMPSLDPPMKTRMPRKWGGARQARPPLDPPMYIYWTGEGVTAPVHSPPPPDTLLHTSLLLTYERVVRNRYWV